MVLRPCHTAPGVLISRALGSPPTLTRGTRRNVITRQDEDTRTARHAPINNDQRLRQSPIQTDTTAGLMPVHHPRVSPPCHPVTPASPPQPLCYGAGPTVALGSGVLGPCPARSSAGHRLSTDGSGTVHRERGGQRTPTADSGTCWGSGSRPHASGSGRSRQVSRLVWHTETADGHGRLGSWAAAAGDPGPWPVAALGRSPRGNPARTAAAAGTAGASARASPRTHRKRPRSRSAGPGAWVPERPYRCTDLGMCPCLPRPPPPLCALPAGLVGKTWPGPGGRAPRRAAAPALHAQGPPATPPGCAAKGWAERAAVWASVC